ncbi:ROK family transcriptional regulator [Salinarimonas rosea]|uniref:ROK family transcriptional regulator n=1 Tax=Salinarimonas rosea TaxID=552063 RepID=UPI000423ADD2|nr:ROK family transcriptional regulator [Salinarimonas rosea]
MLAGPSRRDASTLHRGSNQTGVRAYNERLVLSLLWRGGPLTKTEIARLTGLSAQAASVIVRHLEADGLVRRGAPQRGRVGQPSVPMSLDPDGAYAIGVKIGRRSTDVVLVDLVGRVRARETIGYPYPRLAQVTRFIDDTTDALVAQLGARASRLAGAGIAMPFEIWSWSDIVGAPPGVMDDWREADVRRHLAARLGCPVGLHNDATAACAAEMLFGGAERVGDALTIFVGTFVGGGLALNDGLFVGRTGNAAAIGSLPLRGPDGRPRQLLDEASLLLLERRLERAGIDTAGIWRPDGDWAAFEPHLTAWIDRAAEALAMAIVSAAALVEIETAVVDGIFPSAVRDRLISATAREVAHLPDTGIARPTLRPGRIGPLARALGAAGLALSERYLIDQNTLMRA